MSYHRNYQHIVFRTYRSERSLPEEHKRELLKYIYEICRNESVHVMRINAYLDHVHLLADIPVTLSLPGLVRKIKSCTSSKFKRHEHFPLFNGWGRGYASFSVSYYEAGHIANYIRRQEEHHKSVSFADEYRQMLMENGIQPDEYIFAE